MSLKLHTLCAALALVAATPAAMAQAAAPSTAATPSPSTPPTHPTQRDGTTTAKSMDEAKQACKNLSGEPAQRECMTKAEADFKKADAASAPAAK